MEQFLSLAAEKWEPQTVGAAEVETADVGIVFLHGIGDQERGETLEQFGGALVDFVKAQAEPLPHVEVSTSGGSSRVVDIAANGRRYTWQLSEAWWADDFETPDTRTVVTWSALLAPWLLIREAASFEYRSRGDIWSTVRLLAWLGRKSDRQGVRFSNGAIVVGVLVLLIGVYFTEFSVWILWSLFALWFIRSPLYIPAIRSVALLLAAFGIQLALALLTVASLIPLPVVRKPVRRIHRQLTLSIGDSYAFVALSASEQEIIDSVARQLRLAASSCRLLLVVAHSQGAAVLLQLIRQGMAPENMFAVTTLGSGMGKLNQIRRLQAERRRLIRSALTRTMVGLSTVAVLVADHINGWNIRPQLMLGLGIILLIWAYHTRSASEAATQSAIETLPGLGTQWVWLDLWADADLVPDGETVIPEGAGAFRRTFNSGSYFFDHVTYHESPEVLNEIARAAAQMTPGDLDGLYMTDTPFVALGMQRALRGALKYASLLAFGLGIFLATRWLLARLTGEEHGWVVLASTALAIGVGRIPWLRWHRRATELEMRSMTVPVRSLSDVVNPLTWLRLPAVPLAHLGDTVTALLAPPSRSRLASALSGWFSSTWLYSKWASVGPWVKVPTLTLAAMVGIIGLGYFATLTAPSADTPLYSESTHLAPLSLSPEKAFPLGQPDPVVVKLGSPQPVGEEETQDYFRNYPGGEAERRSVTVEYQETDIPLGNIVIPVSYPSDLVKRNVGTFRLTSVDSAGAVPFVPAGTGAEASCTDRRTGGTTGGWEYTGDPGIVSLALLFESDGRSVTDLGMRLTFDGPADFIFFDDVLDEVVPDEINDRCTPVERLETVWHVGAGRE